MTSQRKIADTEGSAFSATKEEFIDLSRQTRLEAKTRFLFYLHFLNSVLIKMGEPQIQVGGGMGDLGYCGRGKTRVNGNCG